MNSEEIRHLLDKYYIGESTLDEERFLKDFFSQAKIPEDLIDEKEIFSYYLQSVIVPEPSLSFENKIISAIDSLDNRSESLKRRRVPWILSGIAAVMLILTGSYFFFIHNSEPEDTFSDPELAYAETMKILYRVSSQLNDGTRALDRIGSIQEVTKQSLVTINRSVSAIQEKMKPLDQLHKAGNLIDSINEKAK